MLVLGIHVPTEEAVAHVAPPRVADVGSQVSYRVWGRDEAGVRAQVELEALAERVDPVEYPCALHLILRASPPPVVHPVREGFSEVIHS